MCDYTCMCVCKHTYNITGTAPCYNSGETEAQQACKWHDVRAEVDFNQLRNEMDVEEELCIILFSHAQLIHFL